MTQAELAVDAGLSRDSLAQLEIGRAGRSLDHFLRILGRMGATITISFEGSDTEA